MLTTWGKDGFHKHLQTVQAEYHRRRALTEQALRQHMTGIATWILPEAGMFYWIRLLEEPDTTELIADLMDHKRCAASAD